MTIRTRIWYTACTSTLRHMTSLIIFSFFFRLSSCSPCLWSSWSSCYSRVGGSVARPIAARVSMMRLIHKSWIILKGELPRVAPPIRTIAQQTMFTQSWNWRNFLMLSRIFLPQRVALNTELKLSSIIIIWDTSLAISLPVPMQKETSASFRAFVSVILLPVTATWFPLVVRAAIKANFWSGLHLARTLHFVMFFSIMCFLSS